MVLVMFIAITEKTSMLKIPYTISNPITTLTKTEHISSNSKVYLSEPKNT